jgi:lactoylglutathione lyase
MDTACRLNRNHANLGVGLRAWRSNLPGPGTEPLGNRRQWTRLIIGRAPIIADNAANLTFEDIAMRYLHTMVRVNNLDASLDFYCNKLSLSEVRRMESEAGRFTLVYLAAPGDKQQAGENDAPLLELTYNWDTEDYTGGRNFGHLAFEVDDIYSVCQRLMDQGVTINRPPRDGWMAFIRSPDQISIELLQKGEKLPVQEPWASMANIGVW